jgi:hypothetical protein
VLGEPRKTKQKPLDLLGFIWPNRSFSKGCDRKNKKNRRLDQLASQVARRAHLAADAERDTASSIIPNPLSGQNRSLPEAQDDIMIISKTSIKCFS